MIDKIKIEVLKDFIQSGNINFLIGSGLSRPFLPVLGNIEKQMASVKDAPANNRMHSRLSFIRNILKR